MRDPHEVFGAEREAKLDPALLKLVSRLIEERKKPWSLNMVRDPVQAPSNVINIMDALRRSVAADARSPANAKSKKPPAGPKR